MAGLLFPAHKRAMYLTHNEHKNDYKSVKQWFDDHDHGDTKEHFADITPEDYEECLRTDELWVLQWYPDTTVGFYCVAAPTFEKVLARAAEAL